MSLLTTTSTSANNTTKEDEEGRQRSMEERNYTLLTTGYGCSCPKDTEITSKEECLVAAQSLPNITTTMTGEFDNKWDDGPCGCFVWKLNEKIVYADPTETPMGPVYL